MPAVRNHRLRLLLALAALLVPAAAQVRLQRVPNGGIQPQALVEPSGAIDLVYFRGEAAHGDLFFVRSTDGGRHFSTPLRVNHQPGSALAVGTVRGAHLALGRHRQIFVAWVGSDRALPRGPKNAPPILFARLNRQRTAFLPERPLSHPWGLDGGTIAADHAGHVYVFWHAPGPGGNDEAHRRVWMVRSRDNGRHFFAPQPVSPAAGGVCGCCGMSASTDARGRIFVLYRSARALVHRDEFLLVSADHGRHFSAQDVAPWQVGYCVMSTADLVATPHAMLAAWEQQKQVHAARLQNGRIAQQFTPAGNPGDRAHPVLARDRAGLTLLAWTEGTGWQKGGALAWQLFDPQGRPLAASDSAGSVPGLPVWSLPAALALPKGGFLLFY